MGSYIKWLDVIGLETILLDQAYLRWFAHSTSTDFQDFLGGGEKVKCLGRLQSMRSPSRATRRRPSRSHRLRSAPSSLATSPPHEMDRTLHFPKNSMHVPRASHGPKHGEPGDRCALFGAPCQVRIRTRAINKDVPRQVRNYLALIYVQRNFISHT